VLTHFSRNQLDLVSDCLKVLTAEKTADLLLLCTRVEQARRGDWNERVANKLAWPHVQNSIKDAGVRVSVIGGGLVRRLKLKPRKPTPRQRELRKELSKFLETRSQRRSRKEAEWRLANAARSRAGPSGIDWDRYSQFSDSSRGGLLSPRAVAFTPRPAPSAPVTVPQPVTIPTPPRPTECPSCTAHFAGRGIINHFTWCTLRLRQRIDLEAAHRRQ